MAGTDGIPRTDGEITRYTIDRALRERVLRLTSRRVYSPDRHMRRLRMSEAERLAAAREAFQQIRRGSTSDGTDRQAGRAQRQIIYVNGMATDGRAHKQAAKTLAAVLNREVIGIYNATGGDGFDNAVARSLGLPNGLQDFIECVQDYILPASELDSITRLVTRPAMDFIYGEHSEAAKYNMGRVLLGSNTAAVALLQHIYGLLTQNWRVYIVCHSQGNLITSNVLWVLRWARPLERIGTLYVYGLASPAPSWPPNQAGLMVRLYNNANDPVTWLSGYHRGLPPMQIGGRRRVPSLRAHDVVGENERDIRGYMTWATLRRRMLRDLVSGSI